MNSEERERIRGVYEDRARDLPLDYYSLTRPANLFSHSGWSRAALEALRSEECLPLSGRRILEVGCGSGGRLLDFQRWGADARRIFGVDLDPNRLSGASVCLQAAGLARADGSDLPFPDDSFDIVLQATLFTSILDPSIRSAVAKETLRVLRPEGVILWYDFRVSSPGNPNVKGIGSAEIRRLFPGCPVRTKSVTLAPPLARRIVPVSWTLAALLESLPFLRTHLFGVIRPVRAPREAAGPRSNRAKT